MLSQARYEGESEMANTSRTIAGSDEEALLYDQIAGHYATAARHVRFHGEWSARADSERRAARVGPIVFGGGRGPLDPAASARAMAQAERSAQIATNHRQAAEDHQAAAEALRAPTAPPGAPDQTLPPGEPMPDQSLPLVCNTAPYVGGVGAVGETLTSTMGTWTGTPSSYAYQWISDGTTPLGTDASYVVDAADSGHSLTCVVTATNTFGSVQSPPSNAVQVP
jgi:hypothetical protein